MTWQNAKIDARKHVAVVLDMIARRAADGDRCEEIKIADFENENTYVFLKGGGVWPLEYHRMVIRAVKRELQRRKLRVRIVTLRLAEYWHWLEMNNLRDATEHRATFVSGQKI